MTCWEASEKRTDVRVDGIEEIGARLSFPASKLVLRVRLPETLRSVQPYVHCSAPASYPEYEINTWGDAVFFSEFDMVENRELRAAEAGNLTLRCWRNGVEA